MTQRSRVCNGKDSKPGDGHVGWLLFRGFGFANGEEFVCIRKVLPIRMYLRHREVSPKTKYGVDDDANSYSQASIMIAMQSSL
jgi:hypothetical protein